MQPKLTPDFCANISCEIFNFLLCSLILSAKYKYTCRLIIYNTYFEYLFGVKEGFELIYSHLGDTRFELDKTDYD